MRFKEIYQRAVVHTGGEVELAKLLPAPVAKDVVAKLDESVFLAEMTRCIFQAGFSWKVIESKWAGFEKVFADFDVGDVLSFSTEDWDEIRKDTRIVRNGQKINAIPVNARFIDDIMFEHGSFGQFISDWPESDLVGLFGLLKKRGSRLGGNTGKRFLRNVGKDTFVLTRDVIRCLQISGLGIKANVTSKRELSEIQAAFNQWHDESGLSYTHLSKIAAYSISNA